jgi:hypothetical protein
MNYNFIRWFRNQNVSKVLVRYRDHRVFVVTRFLWLESFYKIKSIADSRGNIFEYDTFIRSDRFLINIRDFPTAEFTSCSSLSDANFGKANVKFSKGVAPFTLEVLDPSDQLLTFKDINSQDFSFQVTTPGHYKIVNVKDKYCKGFVPVGDCFVEKLSPPSVAVSYQSIKSQQCTGDIGAEIDLQLTGEGPWVVEISEEIQMKNHHKVQKSGSIRQNKHTVTISSHHYIQTFQPKEPGEFALEAVSDKNCPGIIPESEKNKVIKIRYHKSPEVMQYVSKPEIHSDCYSSVQQDGNVELEVKGELPINFYVESRCGKSIENNIITVSDSFVIRKTSESLLVSLPVLSIIQKRISSERPEDVEVVQTEYFLTGISDNNYSGKISLRKPIVLFNHTIEFPPAIKLRADQRKKYQCAGEQLKENQLSVELFGKRPWNLTYEVYDTEDHTSRIFEESNINSKLYHVPLLKLNKSGNFEFRVLDVKDSSKCKWSKDNGFKGEEMKEMQLHVIEAPSLEPLYETGIERRDPEYICLGETFIFKLKGAGPWTIKYSLNDEEVQTQNIKNNRMYLHSEKAGYVKIHQICNTYCCQGSNSTKSDPLYTIPIYDLPSAYMNQGEDEEQDIREGDTLLLNVSFVGVPPFDFSYQKILFSDDDECKLSNYQFILAVVETYSHNGIKEKYYSISTDEEGTFKLLSVKDKYCQFPQRKQ